MGQRPGDEPSKPDDDSIARVLAGWRASRPDLDVAPIAITARLGRLRQALGSRLEQVFTEHGLSSADFAVLATIVRLGGKPLSQKQLMAELNLTAGTISVRVDRLVTNNLVRRGSDAADGRGSLLELTSAGRAAFEACAPEHLANAQALVGALSAEEHDQLASLLGKLLRSLE
jgi:DNA-binding MarR family transcriptional regulator